MRRRAILGAGLALGGCGFSPLYAPTATGTAGPVAQEMTAIRVGPIPERQGMLLRQALQARLEREGSGGSKYDLTVLYSISYEGIGYRRDDAISRQRMIASANWVLRDAGTSRAEITRGHARAMDAYNILDNQFFASDLSGEAAQRRLADAIADQIQGQLGTFFAARARAS